MGLPRGSRELVNLAQSLTIAVRADRPGVKFVDYHTVTGAPMMAANGEPRARRVGDTIVTPREYLQDACFTVFLEMEPLLEEKIVSALKNPRWCIYLGRKSCVPSRPVLEYTGEGYDSLMDAVFQYPVADRASWPMVYECEIPSEDRASLLRPDGLAGPEQEFSLRRVWRGTVKEGNYVSDQSGNGEETA